jgi:Spy/CpxP family protein refolding chaperone
MRTNLRRFVGDFAAVLALGLSAGISAAGQDRSGGPGGFGRGFGGPGRPGGPGGPMGGPMGMPPLPPSLNLTDAQREQIKAIADSHRDEWKALADRARTAHEALMAVEMSDPIDENAIRAKSADVAAVEADMAVARAHSRAEVFQVLTADQKAELKQMQNGRGRGPRR